MQQLKVLYILGAYGTAGGVESFVQNILENIDHKKIKIDVVLFNGLDHSRIEVLKRYHCRIFYIDRIRLGIVRFIYETYKILKYERYDIVHAHINEIGLFSTLAGMIAHIPVRICHSHNTAFSNQKVIPFLRVFFRIFPTHLFACSHAAGKALFGDKANFIVVKNAINVSKYIFNEKIRRGIRQELNIADKFVVGNVGRFSYQKNHYFMLEILKKIVQVHQNTTLVLIGQGEMESEIRNKSIELGLQNNILFLGARNNVNELMQGMDVFLFPSHYEGLAVVLVEAQAASLPCIVSDYISREAKITNLVEFISLNKSSKYWADRILSFLGESKRENRQRELVDAGYEMKCNVLNLENLYMKLIKDGKA